MTDHIIVSVAIITRNHEKYISDNIRSVLSQNTSFPYEVVISDDRSNDATCQKIETLIAQNKNPNCSIKFFKQDSNLGIMSNLKFVLTKSKGKYIALCEGDDYWTDPNKLQIQYDALENSFGASLCFHNALKLFESSGKKEQFAQYFRKRYVSNDLYTSWLIPTASAFFLNVFKCNGSYPDYLAEGTHGDLALFTLLGEYGDFIYVNKTMSVYRISKEGVTQNSFKGLDHNSTHILQLQRMMRGIKNVEARLIVNRINSYLISSAHQYFSIGEIVLMQQTISHLTYPLSIEQRKELLKLRVRILWKNL